MKKIINIEVFKKNVDITRLLKEANNIDVSDVSNNKSYFISYKEFLKYFSDLKEITRHNVIIGINFTYGWMPTIFNFKSNKEKELELIELKVIEILNKAKKGKIPSEDELDILKNFFNNSLVGTSKLLHFINPNKFAIWDSRVFRYLTNQEPYQNRIDNYKSYLDYLKFCKYTTEKPEYNEIHNLIIKKFNYKMTKFRTIELIMYLKGGKNNNLI